MNWKMIFMIMISFLFFVACGDQDSESNDHPLTPPQNIKNLSIIQDNGNVRPGDTRFIEYDFDQNELSDDAVQLLDEITTTSEDLYCSNDGITYVITITDDNEDVFTYASNNRDCGRENESLFISVDDIENLISALD